MSRFSFIFVALALLAARPAAAQPTNPVLTYYRAYAAALEGGDLEAAEVAARAALSASEARDGDGGSTAVLALNLAQLLLERGNFADAAAPAAQALRLAELGGANARVDPLVANLAVHRAALPAATADSAEVFWLALSQAHEGGTRNEPVFDAARDLGEWGLEHDATELAIRAWGVAVAASPGDEVSAVLARAEALRGLGASLLLRDIARNSTVVVSGITRRSETINADTSPIVPLIEAVRLTRPLAAAPGPRNNLTNAQYSFAVSLALLNAARARLGSMNGWGEVENLADWSELGGLSLGPDGHASGAICQMRVTPQPNLRFPREAQNRYGVGSVVMMVRFAPDGSLLSAEPVATAGGEAFANEARRVRWSAARGESNVEGCTPPAVWFRAVSFVYPD